MSGNSFGLYSSSGGNVTVGAGNTSGLYRLNTAVIVDTGYGNVDVQAFLEQYTGNIQCGNIDVLNTANINALYATNYYYANGTPFVPSGYGNANVAAFLPTYTGNLAGSNLGLTGNILVGQNIVSTGNVTSGQNIIAGGDVQAAGNLRTTGAAGNITGANYVVASYFVGDGSQLSNISASYGNSNVSNYLASGTNSANIITTGNISGSYILGNGSQLTGLPATYSNAEVATFLANFGSNVIVTTGNITGGTFIGSGAGLTAIPGANITGTVANATYATTAGTATTADSVAGANVTGQVANALVAGTVYTAAQPAITSVGTLTSLAVSGNITANNISTTGNVTVSGSLESDDITSTNITVYGNQVITGNLTVQGNTTTINSNVITTNDKTITVANNQSTGANVNGAGIEAGNPAVATWLYNDLTTSWQSNVNLTPTSNITLNLGTNTNRWATVYAEDANLSGTATAVAFVGNGSGLTSLTGANVTGTVANATYATTAGHASTANTVTDAAQPAITSVGTLVSLGVTGNITSSGNISGSYFLGNGSQLTGLPEVYGNANVANFLANFGSNTIVTTGNITGGNLFGTIRTAAQPNITSVGTLTSLNVSGNITSQQYVTAANVRIPEDGQLSIGYDTGDPVNIKIPTGLTTGWTLTLPPDDGNSGQFLQTNGSGVTTWATPTSSYGNTQVAAFLANLGANAISSTANITTTANVTGAYVLGDGSALSSLTGANVTGQVANALVAGTVYTAAQPAITSVGTLTSLAVTGNITGGNLISGAVTYTPVDGTAGQILTTYGNGQTYWTSGGGGSYGDSNVNTLLASWGSNTLSTTGNVTAGNFNTSGQLVATGNVTGGNVKSGAVTYTPTDGTNGQVLTTYGNGVTYFSTVSGGGGSLSGNLAGNIFANGFAFTSTSNGNVTITADGTGLVNISKARLETYREVLYAIGNTSGDLAANVNVLNGSIQSATLTGNITLNSITNMAAGQNITLILTQDATGSRVLTSTMKYAGAYKTLSTAANATDILSIFYDGTTYWASLNIGYA